MSKPDHTSPAYKAGMEDGSKGRSYNSKSHAVQAVVDYRAGYEAGEAIASGDTEPMTEEERREIYGEEHDRL